MPWKESRVEHLKMEFVLQAVEKSERFTVLCRKYGISRKTGYKWLKRYEQLGLEGLREVSRRPKHSPLEIGGDIVAEVVRLRLEHEHWGPKKLRELVRRKYGGERTPSVSSIARVLR